MSNGNELSVARKFLPLALLDERQAVMQHTQRFI